MVDKGNTMIIIDGVPISLPKDASEWKAFNAWLKKNGDVDPYNPAQHYDLLGAFRAGFNRVDSKGNFAPLVRDPVTGHFISGGHLPDTFKLPGHPTFSIQSKYYKPGMPSGKWEGDKYIPIDRDHK